jgi:hypothetical protein
MNPNRIQSDKRYLSLSKRARLKLQPFNGFCKQQNVIFSGWTPNLNRASDATGMAILKADHPVMRARPCKA